MPAVAIVHGVLSGSPSAADAVSIRSIPDASGSGIKPGTDGSADISGSDGSADISGSDGSADVTGSVGFADVSGRDESPENPPLAAWLAFRADGLACPIMIVKPMVS